MSRLNNMLHLGFDIFPVTRTQNEAVYELFHVRGHLLGVKDGKVHHYTMLTNRYPKAFEDCTDELDAYLSNGYLPGVEISADQLTGMNLRQIRYLRPERGEIPNKGKVVGHITAYSPDERLFKNGEVYGPQVIQILAVMVPTGKPDRPHKTLPVRLHSPGAHVLDPGKSPQAEFLKTWGKMRSRFPMGEEVGVVPRSGYYLLGNEASKREGNFASVDAVRGLAAHFAGASAK